jgi:histidinol-phosphate aminotransferase
MLPGIRPEVGRVQAYQAGATIEEVKRRYGLDRVVKLGSNENPYGPFPAAKAAMQREVERLHTYPDASFVEIKRVIAALYGLESHWVAISHGAGGMLETLARSFLEPGSHVLLPATTYGLYREISTLMGAEVERVPLDEDFRSDIGALRRALRPDTRLIWLCNPNNPTGTLADREAIEALAR